MILRDTGLLFSQVVPEIQQVLTITKPTATRFAAIVSFGGDSQYPDGLTTTDVMAIHQVGGGNVPVRKILVPPDGKTTEQLAKAGKRILTQGLKDDT